MMKAAELPDDIAALKALVLERDAKIVEHSAALAEREALIVNKDEALRQRDEKIFELATKLRDTTRSLLVAEERYKSMAARYFGRSSEKLAPGEERQFRLFDEAEAHADGKPVPVVEKIVVPEHERKKAGRKAKGEGLPVHEIIHELDEGERACPSCGEARPEIGEERTSEYDLVPASVVKIVHVRKKYGPCACASCAVSSAPAVIVAPGPAKIVKGSDFTNRTIAFFLTGKYADAIPFYRMSKMLERAGLVVGRATLCNLALGVGRAIGDLVEAMNRDLARSPVMLMDETTVQVLREGEGPPGKSYMWVARGYRDGKPIHRFAYNKSRAGAFADTLLEGFSGSLQTDGYAGYRHLEKRTEIMHVGCFAHIRRKFVEAAKISGASGLAEEAIKIIGRIYAFEAEMRKELDARRLDEDEFLERRQALLAPVFEEFRDWLAKHGPGVAPQVLLGKAISYASAELPRASRFVDHALLTPDTNAVENAIRPFVIGRKNWLFSGSPAGAHASAGLYSLIETAKANGHEPFAYLRHIFDTLPECTSEAEREALLPYRLDPSSYKADGEK